MVRDVEFGIFCLYFGVYLHKSWVRRVLRIVLAAHIFERRWYGNTLGDRETKTFAIMTKLSKRDLRGGMKYLTMGLTRTNIWIYKVENGELPENRQYINIPTLTQDYSLCRP